MKLAATTLLAVSVVLGADLPATQIRGNYVEARNADVYTGPCYANSEALKSFAQTMSDDLLADVQRVEYQPISLTFENDDPHSVKAKLTAGDLAAIQTRPIQDGDHFCSNELVWYPPLVKVDHAMPAYTLANSYRGKGLDTIWSSPEKRSAFVGTFHYTD